MSARWVTAKPTIVPAAYGNGDAIGGLLTFANVCSAFEPEFDVHQALLIDNNKQNAIVRLILFDRTFTPTADNAAEDPSDTDLQNVIGFVSWLAADYLSLSDNSVAMGGASTTSPIHLSMKLVDGGVNLYGQLISYGTPTYAAADDLTVKLLISS